MSCPQTAALTCKYGRVTKTLITASFALCKIPKPVKATENTSNGLQQRGGTSVCNDNGLLHSTIRERQPNVCARSCPGKELKSSSVADIKSRRECPEVKGRHGASHYRGTLSIKSIKIGLRF